MTDVEILTEPSMPGGALRETVLQLVGARATCPRITDLHALAVVSNDHEEVGAGARSAPAEKGLDQAEQDQRHYRVALSGGRDRADDGRARRPDVARRKCHKGCCSGHNGGHQPGGTPKDYGCQRHCPVPKVLVVAANVLGVLRGDRVSIDRDGEFRRSLDVAVLRQLDRRSSLSGSATNSRTISQLGPLKSRRISRRIIAGRFTDARRFAAQVRIVRPSLPHHGVDRTMAGIRR